MDFSHVIASIKGNKTCQDIGYSNKRLGEFTEKTLGNVALMLPVRLGIPQVFCPEPEEGNGNMSLFGSGRDKNGTHYNYGTEFHHLSALPLATAVRYLLDETSTRMDLYCRLMWENDLLGDSWRDLPHTLREEPKLLAFCAGMDDRFYRRPTSTHSGNVAASEAICPGYGEEYERGRIIMGKHVGRDHKFGSRIRDYISFGIAMELTDEAPKNFTFMVNIGRYPYPHSDTHGWLREFPADPADTPKSIAEKILDAVQIKPLNAPEEEATETQNTGMRM